MPVLEVIAQGVGIVACFGFLVLLTQEIARQRCLSRVTWEFDREALREACRLLKITRPVKVQREVGSSVLLGAGTYAGAYRFAGRKRPYHHITVKTEFSQERASEVLWHELCHAMQVDEYTHGLPDYLAQQHHVLSQMIQFEIPYASRPVEVEARAYSRCSPYLPLTKKRQGRSPKCVRL